MSEVFGGAILNTFLHPLGYLVTGSCMASISWLEAASGLMAILVGVSISSLRSVIPLQRFPALGSCLKNGPVLISHFADPSRIIVL